MRACTHTWWFIQLRDTAVGEWLGNEGGWSEGGMYSVNAEHAVMGVGRDYRTGPSRTASPPWCITAREVSPRRAPRKPPSPWRGFAPFSPHPTPPHPTPPHPTPPPPTPPHRTPPHRAAPHPTAPTQAYYESKPLTTGSLVSIPTFDTNLFKVLYKLVH